MKKIESFTQHRSFLFQFLLVVIIIFTGVTFLRPKAIEIFQMRKRINEEKEKLVKLIQKEAFLKSLDEYELTSKTQFLLKVLPSEKDIVIPLSALRGLALQFSDIQIKEIQVDLGGEKSSSSLSSIVFSLKITGNKDNIINFIEKIRTIYPLMRIKTVVFSLKEEASPEASINVEAFFLALPKEIGKIESPLSLVTSGEEKIYQEVSSLTSPLTEEAIPSAQVGKENPFSL